MNSNSPRKKRSAQEFWNWFRKNDKPYLFINQIDSEETRDDLLDSFCQQLHKYCDQLYFEIGGHPDDPEVELIITAQGDTNYFNEVEELVSSAPEMQGWKIIAFKPPMGKGFRTDYGGKVFDPSKIIFIPLNNNANPNAIGLQVCYPDFNDDESDVFYFGTYIAIDCLIGEKSASLDIEYLKVVRTPDDISNYSFRHLEDIKDYIEAKKNAS